MSSPGSTRCHRGGRTFLSRTQIQPTRLKRPRRGWLRTTHGHVFQDRWPPCSPDLNPTNTPATNTSCTTRILEYLYHQKPCLHCSIQGCGAVTFLVGSGSGSGSGEAFRLRLRLRLRVKLFGGSGSGSGSGQNVPAPAAPAPAPAPMLKSSYWPKPGIRFSKMSNVKI